MKTITRSHPVFLSAFTILFGLLPLSTVGANDETPPVLSGVPEDLTVECGPVPSPAAVTAEDDVDGAVPVTFAQTVTDILCTYSYTVVRTWTAMDAAGNTATATQTITVADTTPPALTAQADLTLQGNDQCAVPVPALAFAVTDNCGEFISVVQDPPPGTILTGPGDFTITLTGFDECGNLAGDTVTVTVAADAGLGDFVFLDENSNGVPDPGEAGFEGVVVELYDGQLNLLATTITDADGIYTFTGLEPAAYVVGFKAPPGFDFSAGAD
ncbi:MAG: hypothetical protein KJO38_10600, partial [Gammaproteobacteria bacterium]|nr:hypothetical protein [Gammaproteobacteria bacterium]